LYKLGDWGALCCGGAAGAGATNESASSTAPKVADLKISMFILSFWFGMQGLPKPVTDTFETEGLDLPGRYFATNRTEVNA
jgi:hypothetical protein